MEKERSQDQPSYTEDPSRKGSQDAGANNIIQPEKPIKGRVAGGKYLQDLKNDEAQDPAQDYRPLQTVDMDMPVTLIELVHHEDKEVIVLDFVPGDKENPFNWRAGYKAFISAQLCLMTLFIGLATTAYSSGLQSMCDDLGRTQEIGQLGLFTFNMTCAVAPLFLAPFCELVGRRIVYSGGYILFCVTFVGLALGKNIATIIVMRALLGLFGCVGTILVGGTFDDIYLPSQRAWPMATFSYVAILGTVGAPIYAGRRDAIQPE